MFNLASLPRIRQGKTLRESSWDKTGGNADWWLIKPHTTRVLADIKGPGVITHLWMTQGGGYRECLLKITWDDAEHPSVLCPLGDFFGLGHSIVNSYQSLLFTASANQNNVFNNGCALNCYVQMPFRKRAKIELISELDADYMQFFYVDYERVAARELDQLGYFHAEFRRTNPFGGWGHEITVNTPAANAPNKERAAWDGNYVILDTKGRGHYIGCNLSVTNFQGTWWGEGDDMIWVDGYKWPPDLHGTGSEDYLNQAWGMQTNAFLRNGSSIHERNTGGYQTSYVHHLENPVRFEREIKVTIEHGHANHLANEMSSVAYWYAQKPTRVIDPPPVKQRLPVLKKDNQFVMDPERQCPGKPVAIDEDRKARKTQWVEEKRINAEQRLSDRHSRFIASGWKASRLFAPTDVSKAKLVTLKSDQGWRDLPEFQWDPLLVCAHTLTGDENGLIYLARKLKVSKAGEWTMHIGHDAKARVFIDGKSVLTEPTRVNPAPRTRSAIKLKLAKGTHEIVVALATDAGMGWGFYLCFEAAGSRSGKLAPADFPG